MLDEGSRRLFQTILLLLDVCVVAQILEIKKDTERGLGGGTSMELTSKGAGTYWLVAVLSGPASNLFTRDACLASFAASSEMVLIYMREPSNVRQEVKPIFYRGLVRRKARPPCLYNAPFIGNPRVYTEWSCWAQETVCLSKVSCTVTISMLSRVA